MIKVGVFYPLTRRFEWDYYLQKHTPMIKARLGAALKKVEIDTGIGGGTPTSQATYCAICQLHFESVDAFQKAFGPHTQEIMGDIKNYTDVEPVVQISEVKM